VIWWGVHSTKVKINKLFFWKVRDDQFKGQGGMSTGQFKGSATEMSEI
jgi:hypothetical protein